MEYRWLDLKKKPIWIHCKGYLVRDDNMKPLYMIGCVNEIGKRQKADNVSGLLGESGFREYMNQLDTPLETGYLLRIGIDHFKEINDNFGQEYGDFVLKKTAECISGCTSEGQKVYKLVADEFLILDVSSDEVKDADKLYDKVRNEIDRFIESNEFKVMYTVSGGIVPFAALKGNQYSEALKLTDFALNEAKKLGRNRCYIFNEETYRRFLRKREITQELREAVNNGFRGFRAFYQPVFAEDKKVPYGAEALMRFKMKRNEQIEFVSPAEFIPILEESGLIIPTGRWILRQAVACCKKWQEFIPEFKVNVNLSYVQIIKSRILDEIKQALKDYNLKPALLGIEVTESGYLENTYHYKKLWSSLKEEGITLVLDDYGTGYSNAYRLSNLTPHYIKIDRVLTQKALSSNYERSILIYIIEMAHSLKLNVCIEGVETEEELQEIKKLNPDYIQGYLFGKPAPEDEFYNRQIKKK